MRRVIASVGGLLLVLVATYLAMVVVARFRLGPREPAGFFADRPGEHQPLAFAHQGGELLRPSNTMVAFEHAADLGADVLDTDLHRSADGVLVLLHDETVDRTSDGSGAVRDLTLAELRTFDFGHGFTADDGATFPFRGQGLRVVTLDELFTSFDDGMRFGIEIKQTVPQAATELCDTIGRFGYEDRVLVSSFGQDNMDVFRSACPEVATSATEAEVRSFYVLRRLGLNGLRAPPYQALQVPEYSGDRLILTRDFVDAAHAWGLPVVPWTIDDPADLQRMVDLGVDGINTNRPDLLADMLGDG